jgi:aminoglycoside 2'-N-acetyltransferase I
MANLQLAHTAFLGQGTRSLTRAFLAEVFAGEFSNHDWENAIGGIHALLWEDGSLIGHASMIQRRLLHQGRALRAGFLECVGVRADRRRRRHGTTMMQALTAATADVYDLSALCSNEEAKPFYEKLGWAVWRGPLSTLTPDGVRDDSRCRGRVFVLEHSFPLDLDGTITCDWRDGDPWE